MGSGGGACRLYLKDEAHSHIHHDDDCQHDAPVVGNTHDLREGRAAGGTLNATAHTVHTVPCTTLHHCSSFFCFQSSDLTLGVNYIFWGQHSKQQRITEKKERKRVYLQEVVDGRERMQHDEEEESVQNDAGQHERPWWKYKNTEIQGLQINAASTSQTGKGLDFCRLSIDAFTVILKN